MGGCGAPQQDTLTGPTLHTLPFPQGCQGHVGTGVVKSSSRGPELLLGHQPWKEDKDLPAGLWLEPPVLEWDVFSQ